MDTVVVLSLSLVVVRAFVGVVVDNGAVVPYWVDTVDAVVVLGLLGLVGILLALVVVVVDNSVGRHNSGVVTDQVVIVTSLVGLLTLVVVEAIGVGRWAVDTVWAVAATVVVVSEVVVVLLALVGLLTVAVVAVWVWVVAATVVVAAGEVVVLILALVVVVVDDSVASVPGRVVAVDAVVVLGLIGLVGILGTVVVPAVSVMVGHVP